MVQQVNLFTGGLREAIRVDIELHTPTDLQCAMALAHTYERRAVATTVANAPRAARAPGRPQPSAPVSPVATGVLPTSSTTLPPPPKSFRRLTPTDMAERRR